MRDCCATVPAGFSETAGEDAGATNDALKPDRSGLTITSPDSELFNQAEGGGGGNVIERVFLFLLEPLAQVLGGEEAGLAVGEVAAGARPKLHKCGVG